MSATVAAQQRLDVSRFSWRAGIVTPDDTTQTSYAVFRLDSESYRYASPSLVALRIAGPGGDEVPFTIRPAVPAAREPARLSPRLYNRVRTQQGALQFVLDFGTAGTPHNTLRLEWTDTNFRRPVRIESSAQQIQWDLVKEAMLLDFRQDGLVYRTTELTYPESTQRYLRMTVADWNDPSTLTAVSALRELAAKPEWTELATPSVRPAIPSQAGRNGDASYEFTLDFTMPSPLRLDLQVEGAEYVREVELQTRLEGRPWSAVCVGTIAHAAGETRSFLDCPSPLGGEARLLVRNRDNPPIRIAGLRLLHPAQVAVFRKAASGPYTLYAGDPAAARPNYDIELVLARSPAVKPLAARLAGWQPNAAYKPPPAPFSERARGLLVPLLAAAVIAIGGAAFVLIRKAG